MAKVKFEPRELTAKWIERTQKLAGKGQRWEVFDTRCPALSIRIGPRRCSWTISYKLPGKPGVTRLTIGHFDGSPSSMQPEDARAEAPALLRRIHKEHHDPLIERKQKRIEAIDRAGLTFKKLTELFIEDREAGTTVGRPLRAATVDHYRRIFSLPRWRETGVVDMPAATVTHALVEANILEPLRRDGKHIAARRHFGALRAMYGWARSKPALHIDVNPFEGIKNTGKETPRDRWLNEDELAVLWRASEQADRLGPMVRLLLLTGQRPGDVQGLRWSEIHDLDGDEPAIVISELRYKTDKEQVVPLTAASAEIIKALRKSRKPEDDFVFSPTYVNSKERRRLDDLIQATKQMMLDSGLLSEERAGRAFIKPWHLHDCRHTVATHLERLGVPDVVGKGVTGHAQKKGMDRTYRHHDFAEEIRDAVTAWNNYLSAIVGAKSQAARDKVERGTREQVRERMRMVLGLAPIKPAKARRARRRARKAAKAA
jgi:integrase